MPFFVKNSVFHVKTAKIRWRLQILNVQFKIIKHLAFLAYRIQCENRTNNVAATNLKSKVEGKST